MRILFRSKYVRPVNNVTSSLSESFRSDSELTASTSDYSQNIPAVLSKTQHQEGDLQQFTLFRLNNKSEDTDHTLSKSSLLGDSFEYTTTDCKTDTDSHDNDVPPQVNDFGEKRNRCLFAKNRRKHPMRLDNNAPSSPKMKPSLEELQSLTDSSVSDVRTNTTEVVLLRDTLPEFKCMDSTVSTGTGMRKIHALSESNGMATSVGRSVLRVPNLTSDAIKEAKRQAEHALQNGKIFAVFGPYNRVRLALRTRGWVEKFYRSASATRSRERSRAPAITGRKRKSVSLDRQTFTDVDDSLPAYPDDDYSDYPPDTVACSEAECKVPPWLEKDGYYALLSRMVRSALPNFIWSLRKNQVDFRFLRKEQVVNHHCRAPFTTKIGLCRHLRQIRWIDEMDSDTFFPRCFILSEDEDKQAFIEEFRLTACMSLLKLTCSVFNQVTESPKCPLPTDGQKESGFGSARTSASSFLSTDNTFTKMTPRSTFSTPNHQVSDCSDGFELPGTRAFQIPPWSAQNPLEKIPHSVIDMAIARCQYFIRSKFHWDIDQPLSNLSDKSWPWDNFLTWHYIACKTPKILDGLNEYVEVCQSLCGKLSKLCPQFSLDGTYNVWIVKPGAKSRGRGIICCNQLEDLLRIMQSSISFGECRFVVQKYIERPLLVHKTKFDIRQWFLVTDWSPLTVWWYRDCYLRFCSQEFTLDDFSEAIHLSNNSIQHKYENGSRSERLPQENMWTLEEFQQWLLEEGHGETWGKHIEPSMKRAIISTLLCAQEVVEPRKNSFALYGADFILTDDFRLWLIEINASPCMAPSTSVTAKLTSNVLEDTLKVVLDRRSERNCDVGRFELIYRQIIPPPAIYTGLDLRVEGTQVPAAPVEVRGISRQPWIPVTFETAHKRTTLAPIVKLRAKFKTGQQQDEPDELKTTSIRPMATTTIVCSPLPGIEVKAEELKADEERSITSKESRRLVETNHDKELNSSSTEVKLCAETLQTIVSVRSAALATEANQPSVGVDCSKRKVIPQKTNPQYPYRSRCGRSGSQGILRVGSKARAVVAQSTEKRHRSHHRVLNTTLVGDTHVCSQPHTQNHRVGSDMAKCINIPSDLFISNSILHGARNTPISLGDTDLLVDSSAEPTSRCESTRAHSLTGLRRLTPVTECSEIGRATQMSESTPQTKITPHNKCNFKEPQTHLFTSQKSPQGDRVDLANPDQVPANLPNADYKAFTCPSRRLTQNQKPLRLAVITINKKSTPKRRSIPVVNSGGLTTPSVNRPKAIPLKSIKQIKKSLHAPVTKARAKKREVNKSPNGSSWLSAIKMGSTDDNALLGIAKQVFDEARRTAAVHMNLKHVRLSVGQQKVESLDGFSECKTNDEPHASSDHSSEPSLLKSSDQEAASVPQQTANSNGIPDYSQSVRLDANKNPLLKKRQSFHIQSTNMVRPLFSQISAQSASGISGPILKSNDPSSLELDLVDGAPYGLVQLHFLNRAITPKLST